MGFLAFSSCSRQKAVTGSPRLSDYEKNERIFVTNKEAVEAGIYEEFVDSMALKGQAKEPNQERGTIVPPGEIPEPVELPPDVAMGYRVQLGAFSEQNSAENLAARVRKQLGSGYPIYVRYYAPLWKVQAGDCRNREEAEVLRNLMRRNGFPDAWIVSSGIKR